MGRSIPTQGNRFASASDLKLPLVEEADDVRAQRAIAQTRFNSSDPLNSSFFNLSIPEPPQMLPACPPQSTLSPLAQFFLSQQETMPGPQQDTMPNSSSNQSLISSYYPGQTRMLDSSFDQSIPRAPTPQPDFSQPSAERRVSVTRRPAAMMVLRRLLGMSSCIVIPRALILGGCLRITRQVEDLIRLREPSIPSRKRN